MTLLPSIMWYSMNAIGRHHDRAGSHRNQLQLYHQQQAMLLQQPCSVQIPCTFATPMILAGRAALIPPSLRQVAARNQTMMRACSSYTSVLKPSVQMLKLVPPSMHPFIVQQQAAMPTTMQTPVVQTDAQQHCTAGDLQQPTAALGQAGEFATQVPDQLRSSKSVSLRSLRKNSASLQRK